MKNLKVVVADNQKLIADGLDALFSKSGGIEVVAFAKGGVALLGLLKDVDVDLVIMDVTMPQMDGIDTMKEIKRKFPTQKVLAYSALNEIEYINSMRIEGAKGYVLKDDDEKELMKAIRMIMDGHEYLSPQVQRIVKEGYEHTFKDLKGEYVGLTGREREIIRSIALERTNLEIAQELFVSVDTIKTHRKNLMQKLNVRSAAGLVKYAIDRGWIN